MHDPEPFEPPPPGEPVPPVGPSDAGAPDLGDPEPDDTVYVDPLEVEA